MREGSIGEIWAMLFFCSLACMQGRVVMHKPYLVHADTALEAEALCRLELQLWAPFTHESISVCRAPEEFVSRGWLCRVIDWIRTTLI
jgi:hypothetical protein